MIDDISRYASESYSETMAEAFSDCFINGNSAHEISKEIKRLVDIKLRRQIIMHLAPIWDPYIDREKSTIKKKVLKPDTPQEIKEVFEKHREELKKPVKGYVDK